MSRETKNWMIGRFSEKNFKVRQEKNKKFPDLELSLRELKSSNFTKTYLEPTMTELLQTL